MVVTPHNERMEELKIKIGHGGQFSQAHLFAQSD